MEQELNELLDAIAADYDDIGREPEICAEFRAGLSLKKGRKYIKVLADNERRVWGFIQMEDDNKFKAGDLLFPAGYNTPARNKPRGNILEGGYKVQWTGPRYL